jgi:hypothetical protein
MFSIRYNINILKRINKSHIYNCKPCYLHDSLIKNMSKSTSWLENCKDVKTAIPRVESLKFDYSDIDTIYVGPRLDFWTAKLAIEKILIDAGIASLPCRGFQLKDQSVLISKIRIKLNNPKRFSGFNSIAPIFLAHCMHLGLGRRNGIYKLKLEYQVPMGGLEPPTSAL